MNKGYQDLLAWQKAMDLAKETYRLIRKLPDDERFGLAAQMRRAAVSVPSNIAEGQGRLNRGEFRQFLGQARGSLFELETQMKLAVSLGYISKEMMNGFTQLSGETARLLHGLIASMR